MTVGELIRHLKQFPEDVTVLIRMYSEYDELLVEDVELIRAEDEGMLRRNGRYMRASRTWLDPKDGPPEWATVVTFPGN